MSDIGGEQNHEAHIARPRAQRALRGTSSLGVSCGKIFTRTVDANAHFPSIIDYGLAMWQRQDTHQPEPDENRDQWLLKCFLAIEKIYNGQREPGAGIKTIKASLQDPDRGVQFRKKLCKQLASGRSQARSDDKSVLCDLILKHPDLEMCKSTGWSDNRCASLLRTKQLDLDTPGLRDQLNLSHTEAPHDEPFAALYAGYTFPVAAADPFEGYMRSDLFVSASQAVFTGLGSGLGGIGSGERGKGAKAGMSSINAPAIAYVAMLLRFVLRKPGNWYSIKPGSRDKRYNYDTFYVETVMFLEAPVFGVDLAALIEHLNRNVFPNSYNYPHCIAVPGGSSMAQIAVEAEEARKVLRAAARAAHAGDE